MYRFKGFTEKANTALNLAIESAEALGHTYIGTEHIVLGLLQEGTGVAASVLGGRGVTAVQYQQKIVESESSGQHTRLTPEDFYAPGEKGDGNGRGRGGGDAARICGHRTHSYRRPAGRKQCRRAADRLSRARPDELMRDIGKAIGANPAQTASEGSAAAPPPLPKGLEKPRLSTNSAVI